MPPSAIFPSFRGVRVAAVVRPRGPRLFVRFAGRAWCDVFYSVCRGQLESAIQGVVVLGAFFAVAALVVLVGSAMLAAVWPILGTMFVIQ